MTDEICWGTNNNIVESVNDGILYYRNGFTDETIYSHEGIVGGNIKGNKVFIKDNIYISRLTDLANEWSLIRGGGIIYSANSDYVFVEDDIFTDKWELLDWKNPLDVIEIFDDVGYDKVYQKQYSKDSKIQYTDDIITVKKDGHWGVYDFQLNKIVPFEYDEIVINENTITAKKDNRTTSYNYDGSINYDEYSGECGEYSEDLYYYKDENNNQYYRNENGKNVIQLDKLGDITHGSQFINSSAVITFNDGKKTYINKKGKILTDERYDDAYNFVNGYALVMVKDDANTKGSGKQWYVINEDFDVVKKIAYDIYPYELTEENFILYNPQYSFSDGYIMTFDHETRKIGFIILNEV